jgi:hypothetical protein
MIQCYADHPNMSTEPNTADDNGDLLAVVACDAEGEACFDSANAWGQEKSAMRKALGIW